MNLDLNNQTFTTAQVAARKGVTVQAVFKWAKTHNWKAAPMKTQGGGYLWYFKDMDENTKSLLTAAAIREHKPEPVAPEVAEARAAKESRLAELGKTFELKTHDMRERAYFRTKLLKEVVKLHETGETLKNAFAAVAFKHDVKAATLRNWYFGTGGKEGVRGYDVKDWPLLLLDKHEGRTVKAPCDEIAWEFLKKDYLRKERPSFRSCYRRLETAANAHGWVIPSERTLKRRMNAEFTKAVIDFLRTGKMVVAFPDVQRMRWTEPVGHSIDMDVNSHDTVKVFDETTGEVFSPHVCFVEDIGSAKITAYAVDKTENSDMIQAALYEHVSKVSLPYRLTIDNTTAFSNLDMMGQVDSRKRTPHKSHHPKGKMIHLGIEVITTNPDHEISSPGSKPIERAFSKGGLHEGVREHPDLIGRGTLQKPVPLSEYLAVLAKVVAEYNARTGRKGGICNGRSFDQVFNEGYAAATQRKASPQLLRLLLLKQEVCRVSKHGVVFLKAGQGYAKHRYYGDALVRHEGEHVAVFFNPKDLTEQVTAYDLEGRLIGVADWKPATAFRDTKTAREHNKHKQRIRKLDKQRAKEAVLMSDLEFQQLNVTPPTAAMPAADRTITVLAQPEIRDMLSKPLDTEKLNKFRQNMHRNIAAV